MGFSQALLIPRSSGLPLAGRLLHVKPTVAYAQTLAARDSAGTNDAYMTGYAAAQLDTAWTASTHNSEGYALRLDGSTNYVNAGQWGTKTGAVLTASLWFKCTGTNGRLISTRNGTGKTWELFVESGTGHLAAGDNDVATFASDVVVNDNTWRHGAVVFNGAASKLYVNGVAVKTFSPNVAAGSYGELCIGTIGLGFLCLNGTVDDARIYNVALTDDQVAELYTLAEDEEVTGAAAIAQWRFDEGAIVAVENGDPAASVLSSEGNSYQFFQVNTLKRPLWVASGLNGKPILRFDGVDDYLATLSAALTGEIGTVVFYGQLSSAPNAAQTLLSQADTAGDTRFLGLYPRLNTATPNVQYSQNDAGTADTLTGDTEIAATTAYCMVWDTGGTGGIIRAFVNGTAQTLTAASGANNGDWWSDITGADVTALGALVRSSASLFGAIDLAELIVYNRVLTPGELARVLRYGMTEYGVSQ